MSLSLRAALGELELSLEPVWAATREAEAAVEALWKRQMAISESNDGGGSGGKRGGGAGGGGGAGAFLSLRLQQTPTSDFRSTLSVGDAVDAFDAGGCWCPGVVTAVQRDGLEGYSKCGGGGGGGGASKDQEEGNGQLLRHVKVSYEGWAAGHAEFDEWFSVHSDRLAPANSHVPRSSGLGHCKTIASGEHGDSGGGSALGALPPPAPKPLQATS